MEEKEKKVEMVEMELDLDAKTVEHLLEHARNNIINDKEALINWAANDILKQIVETDGEVLKGENDGKGNS